MSELWDIYDKSGNRTGRTIKRGEELQSGNYHPVLKKMRKIIRIQRKDNFTDIWLIQQNFSLEELVIQES